MHGGLQHVAVAGLTGVDEHLARASAVLTGLSNRERHARRVLADGARRSLPETASAARHVDFEGVGVRPFRSAPARRRDSPATGVRVTWLTTHFSRRPQHPEPRET